jgi:hypothetical protein
MHTTLVTPQQNLSALAQMPVPLASLTNEIGIIKNLMSNLVSHSAGIMIYIELMRALFLGDGIC